MKITNLSFHEICELVKVSDDNEINHILSQMIPYVHFENYDIIDYKNKMICKQKKRRRDMVLLGGAHRGY